jgi:tRNA modification GTPase
LKDLIEPIGKLLSNYQSAHVFRDGVRFSIVGKPNVGKSSLLNRLLESSKAIVTPYPGTTRDPVEGFTQINGIPILFADTAGLRPSDDPIEQIGMQKTRECIEQADFVFFVLQADKPVSQEDREIYKQVQHKNVVLLINKIDLVSTLPHWPSTEFPKIPIVPVSALSGEGLSDLKDAVVSALSVAPISTAHESVPTLRQKKALETALDTLSAAVQAIDQGTPEDLILYDLEAAKSQLSIILGQTASTDLLDEIFNRFCIGK